MQALKEEQTITKNLLFTGERGVGKSTLLRRLLQNHQLQTGGFRTLPFAHKDIGQGFYILGSNELPLPAPGPERIIALRTGGERIQQKFTEVFETVGVHLLTHCLHNHPDLIMMDELGFLESGAKSFQQHVFNCLDAPVPVWGVIKPLSTPFLDSIRKRHDVTVVTVTIDNRDWLYNELKERGLFHHDA